MSHNSKYIADPKIIGPGIWVMLHQAAIEAQTEEGRVFFRQLVDMVARTLRCAHCKKNFNDYLTRNPLRDYETKFNKAGLFIGYFEWTWKKHNEVNRENNKTLLSFNEALSIYNNTVEVCTNCGKGAELEQVRPLNRYQIQPRNGQSTVGRRQTIYKIIPK